MIYPHQSPMPKSRSELTESDLQKHGKGDRLTDTT